MCMFVCMFVCIEKFTSRFIGLCACVSHIHTLADAAKAVYGVLSYISLKLMCCVCGVCLCASFVLRC